MDEPWGWLDYGWRAGDAGAGVWLDVRGPEKATAFWNKGISPEGERVVPTSVSSMLCSMAYPREQQWRAESRVELQDDSSGLRSAASGLAQF